MKVSVEQGGTEVASQFDDWRFSHALHKFCTAVEEYWGIYCYCLNLIHCNPYTLDVSAQNETTVSPKYLQMVLKSGFWPLLDLFPVTQI